MDLSRRLFVGCVLGLVGKPLEHLLCQWWDTLNNSVGEVQAGEQQVLRGGNFIKETYLQSFLRRDNLTQNAQLVSLVVTQKPDEQAQTPIVGWEAPAEENPANAGLVGGYAEVTGCG